MDLDKLDELLAQWEETYKKGLLSFWLLLLLSKRRAYPYEINKAIRELSQNTISADENSIYRALNRLTQSGVVDSQVQSSDTGPSRRYYFLTDLGSELLTRFITRNILVFQQANMVVLINQTLSAQVDRKENL